MLESLLNHDVHATSQASTSWWSDRSSGHCDCSRRGLEISADPGCSDQISTFLTRWKFFSVFVLKLIHWDLFLFFLFLFCCSVAVLLLAIFETKSCSMSLWMSLWIECYFDQVGYFWCAFFRQRRFWLVVHLLIGLAYCFSDKKSFLFEESDASWQWPMFRYQWARTCLGEN